MSENYDASAIQILTPEDARDRFGFARAAELAMRYPSTAPEFIERLIEACALAGFPLDAAVRRYLDLDKTVEVSQELREIHRALLDRRHHR